MDEEIQRLTERSLEPGISEKTTDLVLQLLNKAAETTTKAKQNYMKRATQILAKEESKASTYSASFCPIYILLLAGNTPWE